MKIGERIRNLRQSSNLTQEELADRANLTKGFISQIERDLTSISLDSLVPILEALDENISDFFREASEEKIVYREKDRVAIEKEKIERFELLVPGSTNRRLEPILLTLRAVDNILQRVNKPIDFAESTWRLLHEKTVHRFYAAIDHFPNAAKTLFGQNS